MEKITDCPFCEGDIDGCCFCDHSGKIRVGGKDSFFKEMDELKPFQVDRVKESDLRRMYDAGGFNSNRGTTQSINNPSK